jgi:ABC-2 type transport system ATP-binding protein
LSLLDSAANEAVRVAGLCKFYGANAALNDLSLSVSKGEVFGLLGPNGAGKTSLIRILVGAARPSKGSVAVLGLAPSASGPLLRSRIGYMPQAPALYEELSPTDNVSFFARAHGIRDIRTRVEESLAFVELKARCNDPVYTLSGGMRQRVSLACALVHRPELLLLDEPTAGVDPKLRESFWKAFRTMADSGVTLLISTHQMDEALYCDRLAIIRQGGLLALDTPDRLLALGEAVINIWRGEEVECVRTPDYESNLPKVLEKYHLDPAVTRITVEEENLERIVLRLINSSGHRQEAGNE